MKASVRTRGIREDYEFIGDQPMDPWWDATLYKNATSFEHSSLIFERDAPGRWRCFISGIPSARRDRVNTRIRYSIALAGDIENDRDVFFVLATHALTLFQVDPPPEGSPLTRCLDRVIGEREVEWTTDDRAAAQAIVDGLPSELAAIATSDVEPSSQTKTYLTELERVFVSQSEGDVRVAAMLNFIGGEDVQVVSEVSAQLPAGHTGILLLPSVVAGGQGKSPFTVHPQLSVPSAVPPSSSDLYSASGKQAATMDAVVDKVRQKFGRNKLTVWLGFLLLLISVGGVLTFGVAHKRRNTHQREATTVYCRPAPSLAAPAVRMG